MSNKAREDLFVTKAFTADCDSLSLMVVASLTRQEEDIALGYNSKLFGMLHTDQHVEMILFLQKAIKVYECHLPHLSPDRLPSVLSYLGHWNLLIGQYDKALSAYQKALSIRIELLEDTVFLFGIGLVYCFYGVFRHAISVFQKILWIDPEFERAVDIRFRLALMFKSLKNYEQSYKYYKMVYHDESGMYSSVSKEEVLFSMAHLLEVQGKYDKAHLKYKKLLESDASPTLKANVMRQLAWMTFYAESLGSLNHRLMCTIDLLSKAVLVEPDNSMNHYYFGRCLTAAGKINDAFFKYRTCIDRGNGGADVWCSIGNLYQQQNQISDALQAYVCSLQLQSSHAESWVNLGTLYESVGQSSDALIGYMNAAREKEGTWYPQLQERINVLKHCISNSQENFSTNKVLPPIETLLIPSQTVDTTKKAPASTSQFPDDIITGLTSNVEEDAIKDEPLSYSLIPAESLLPLRQCLPAANLLTTDMSANKILQLSLTYVPLRLISMVSDFPPDSLCDVKIPFVPCIYLESKKDVLSPNIMPFCLNQPLVLLRNFSNVLRLQLGLFSTKSFAEIMGSQRICITTQKIVNKGLRITASQTFSTVARFAQYQARSFCDMITSNPVEVSFASNIEISSQMQLQVLASLPTHFRPQSVSNLLSYIGEGRPFARMNVPGVRWPAKMSSLCSFHLNIGPGDLDWKIVPANAWGNFYRYCERNGIDFWNDDEHIWPILDELRDIPVARCIQKPGDLLWLGAETVHWVNANGWCNTISWNVMPMSSCNFESTMIHYELSRLRLRSPPIPLIFLCWNLARSLHFTDCKLYEKIKHVLMESLRNTHTTLQFVRTTRPDIRMQLTRASMPVFCSECGSEIFNVMFVLGQLEQSSIYCKECAVRRSPFLRSFLVFYQYEVNELCLIYDRFQLYLPAFSIS